MGRPPAASRSGARALPDTDEPAGGVLLPEFALEGRALGFSFGDFSFGASSSGLFVWGLFVWGLRVWGLSLFRIRIDLRGGCCCRNLGARNRGCGLSACTQRLIWDLGCMECDLQAFCLHPNPGESTPPTQVRAHFFYGWKSVSGCARHQPNGTLTAWMRHRPQ